MTTKERWKAPGESPGRWYEIRAEFSSYLTDQEVWAAAGCLGYALRQILHGEKLSEPLRIKRTGDGRTIARFGYDATKGRASSPDAAKAFSLASQYIQEGSPVRKTNRAGENTLGTRLCEGLGSVAARFWVR